MITPEFVSYVNFGIAVVVPILILILILAAKLSPALTILDFRENPNTFYCIVFWGVWWVTVLPFYALGTLVSKHIGRTLALLDFGNFCLFTSTVALSQGRSFRLTMLWSLFVLLGVLLIWDLSIAPFTKDAMLMKFVAIAPSAVLSHLSLIFLGWLFVVRWGLPGIPFLLLSVV